jgi:hypothetical protein
MTTSTKIVPIARVALYLPTKPVDLVTYATHVVNAMTGNAAFPSPTPTLAAIMAAATALQVAETAVLARGAGSVATRNQKKAALRLLFQQLGRYIQSVADETPENGPAIIASAGVAVGKTRVHAARAFTAQQGPVSGSAHLTAIVAARRASYEWQSSVDGGHTWVTAPGTLKASATITGLPVGVSVQFRSRAVTKAGEGDWSQSVVLVVR